MEGFPQYTLAPGDELWRIHKEGMSPWFFRNNGRFRFDLVENPAYGTCYFAEEPLGAFVETLQGFRTVPMPRVELVQRRLFHLEVSYPLTLADTTHNAAARFGIDGSIAAGAAGHYGRSQAFAKRALDAGFAGVRYRVRNDMTQNLLGIALFGPLGSHEPIPPMPAGVSDAIPESLVSEACQTLQFRVRGPLLEPV
jgi:RES domain